MSEWQDIETAPKDGKKFLAADKYDQYTCRWASHFMRTLDGGDKKGWVRADGQAGNTANPTHWKPLGPLPHNPEKEE